MAWTNFVVAYFRTEDDLPTLQGTLEDTGVALLLTLLGVCWIVWLGCACMRRMRRMRLCCPNCRSAGDGGWGRGWRGGAGRAASGRVATVSARARACVLRGG